jgi:F-type H+-transporting ATPase subunit c
MIELIELIHYLSIALAVGLNSVAVGIGEGLATKSALQAIDIQPHIKSEIQTTAIMGMALIETAAIMGVAISIIMLFATPVEHKTIYFSLAEIGIVCAICLTGLVIGIVSAWPVQSGIFAIARQPFSQKIIMRFMLIAQSIIQTPIIFGFIIAMFIKTQAVNVTTLGEGLRLLASGLCIGLGSIGPAIGLAWFSRTACACFGINKHAYNKLIPFTFISQAIIETPIIFALVIALILISSKATTEFDGIAFLAAGLCIGLGTLGAGISSGRTAAAACQQITREPQNYSLVSKVSLFAQGLIDTCAIYALLISFALIILK